MTDLERFLQFIENTDIPFEVDKQFHHEISVIVDSYNKVGGVFTPDGKLIYMF